MRPLSISFDQDIGLPLAGMRVSFIGKLGGVTRREAKRFVRAQGGVPVDVADASVDLIVVGADELPLNEQEELLDAETQRAAGEGRLEIISETQLWQRLGMVDQELNIRGLYTPAMLADLLKVSVATIRRWHRRGLIVPVREVHRLPYFDFQEVATARHLAQLLAAGASAAAIERKLAELSRYVPEVERPLAQLSVIVEGQRILLRQGEGLLEPGGQMRFDFCAIDSQARQRESGESDVEPTLPMLRPEDTFADFATPAEMLEFAGRLDDEGNLEAAADMYRAVLSAAGPRAEVCFQLAELLYRTGDIMAARERYYMAIELDEDYVEARANLGCVLAETGRLSLAVAAFEGALEFHPDFPDAHYHLARTLDELDRHDEAEFHWRTFVGLTPSSPWADEARARLDFPVRD